MVTCSDAILYLPHGYHSGDSAARPLVSLTDTSQEMVDNSPSFPEVLKLLETWLDKHDLREEDGRLKDAAWVTDGVSFRDHEYVA